MRGLRAFNFKKGIIGNSTLSLDSLILHVMDTGISITEGVVEIYDVVINGPPNDMGTVGIAYSGVHGELNVNSCFITCFEVSRQVGRRFFEERSSTIVPKMESSPKTTRSPIFVR